MATQIASLGIEIKATDIKKAVAELKRLEKQGKRVENSTDKMTSSFAKLGPLIATIASSVVIGNIIKTAASFETMKKSLETVTGSAEKANEAFKGIQSFARNTPFSVSEITDSFIKLKSLGLQPTERALTSFGNTSSAMGRSLNQMIEAVADAATGEFERLKEFGIKSKSEGDKVTFTFQGIKTTVGKNAKEITAFLESIGETTFAGAMAGQMDTVNGSFSNASDAVDNLADKLGEAGLNTVVKELNLSFANLVNNIADAFSEDDSVRILEKNIENIQTRIFGLQAGIEIQQENNFFESLLGGSVDESLRQINIWESKLDALQLRLTQAQGDQGSLADGSSGAEKETVQGLTDEQIASIVERDRLLFDARMQLESELTSEEMEVLQEKLDEKNELEKDANEKRLDNYKSILQLEIDAEAKANNKKQQLEKKYSATIVGMKLDVANQAIGLLKMLVDEDSAAGKVLVVAEKGLAMAQIAINTEVAAMRAMADLGPVAGAPFAASIRAMGKVSMGIVAATGIAQIAGVGGGGATASVGSVSSAESEPFSDLNRGLDTQNQRGSVTINVSGVMTDEIVNDLVIPAIQDAVDDRDVVLIRGDSRNAQEIIAA